MIAGRANLRCLGADNDMSAVSAFPDFDFALRENLLRLYIVQQRAVSFLVVLFDFTDQTEFCRQLREALRLSGLGNCILHICPLVVFALCCRCKILCGVTDACKLFEPHLCMLLFVVSRL